MLLSVVFLATISQCRFYTEDVAETCEAGGGLSVPESICKDVAVADANANPTPPLTVEDNLLYPMGCYVMYYSNSAVVSNKIRSPATMGQTMCMGVSPMNCVGSCYQSPSDMKCVCMSTDCVTAAPPTDAPPTLTPTAVPTAVPTDAPPTLVPTAVPTAPPTLPPTLVPTAIPTTPPTLVPTAVPTAPPTLVPTVVPTTPPTLVPTAVPTITPTDIPTAVPTLVPTLIPTLIPTLSPTVEPTVVPTATTPPTSTPTVIPTAVPMSNQTDNPSPSPTNSSSIAPTQAPTDIPTPSPTLDPVTSQPGVPVTPLPTDTLEPVDPPEEVDLVIEKSEETSNAITGVAGVAALATPVAAAAAAHASMVALMMDGKCSDEPKRLPVALHPIKALGWDTIDGSEDISAIIGNMTICAGVSLICFLLLLLLTCLSPLMPPALKVKNLLEAQGLLRFPSTGLFVLLFLYQGSVFSSMRLIGYADKATHRVVGFIATLVLLVTPHLVAYTIKTSVPTAAFYKVVDSMPNKWMCISGKIIRATIGSGEWVSVRRSNRFVQRYQTMLRSFKQDYSWFIYFDFMSMVLLAGATIPRTPTWNDCGHVKLFSAVVNLLMLASKIAYKPYARYRDNVLEIPRFGIQAAALFVMALAFYSGNPGHWGFSMAGPLFIIAIALLLLKVLLDIITELYIFCTNRRDHLQEQVFIEYEQREEDFDKDMECINQNKRWSSSTIPPLAPLIEATVANPNGIGRGKEKERRPSVALSSRSQKLSDYLLPDTDSDSDHEDSAESMEHRQDSSHPFVRAWKEEEERTASPVKSTNRVFMINSRRPSVDFIEAESSNESFGKPIPKSYRTVNTSFSSDVGLNDVAGNRRSSHPQAGPSREAKSRRSSSAAFTDSTMESMVSIDKLFSRDTNKSSRSNASSRRSRRLPEFTSPPLPSAMTPPTPPRRRPPIPLPRGRGSPLPPVLTRGIPNGLVEEHI
eukprot:TRINITY_DN8458_c1_g1_i2.p1 TRINITY_DN8458_c1_g1~~TRINITY_DN8458_c1_g1_i2.p1  ORF type:complete len:970 (+),score=161.82 TRINITY_DN8458_c1_g1_i2:42-2951(+)